MKHESSGPILTTVFVDYDNIYLSLKRKSDEAAKRFAKDSGLWLQGLQNGSLITPTSGFAASGERRLVMCRCYGNPVPRRNASDNSTDMNSFPFVRHHFLRAGFEVIDCPPLTAQLKNSADIRIVMDIRDLLTHDTKFDEFIILSGDADFTPVLHRLRAHARHTVVFANDTTAQPYTAISDGEIRESSLISLLLNARLESDKPAKELTAPHAAAPVVDVAAARQAILAEVIAFVRSAPQAVPLETLADRAVRMVGHDKTVGTSWGGFGSFRDLLLAGLPDDLHLSDTAPYTVFDANRHISPAGLIAPQIAAPPAAVERSEPRAKEQPQPSFDTMGFPGRAFQPAPASRLSQNAGETPLQAQPVAQQPPPQQPPLQQPVRRQTDRLQVPPVQNEPIAARDAIPQRHVPLNPAPQMPQPVATHQQMATPQLSQPAPEMRREPARGAPPVAPPQPQPAQRGADQATQIQQSITRIHDACQAPALAPAEYRVLFDVMAQEISANGLQGAHTLVNITQRAREFGLDIKRDDLRFILEVVSESDPWFEQGASANLFASRFRNFVVARCRSQGLSLSADELDLIEAWFSAQVPPQAARAPAAPPYGRTAAPAAQAPVQAPQAPQQQSAAGQAASGERWWSLEESRQHIAEQRGQPGYGQQTEGEDEFPRIVRTRLRG